MAQESPMSRPDEQTFIGTAVAATHNIKPRDATVSVWTPNDNHLIGAARQRASKEWPGRAVTLNNTKYYQGEKAILEVDKYAGAVVVANQVAIIAAFRDAGVKVLVIPYIRPSIPPPPVKKEEEEAEVTEDGEVIDPGPIQMLTKAPITAMRDVLNTVEDVDWLFALLEAEEKASNRIGAGKAIRERIEALRPALPEAKTE